MLDALKLSLEGPLLALLFCCPDRRCDSSGQEKGRIAWMEGHWARSWAAPVWKEPNGSWPSISIEGLTTVGNHGNAGAGSRHSGSTDLWDGLCGERGSGLGSSRGFGGI